eukprot:236136_1
MSDLQPSQCALLGGKFEYSIQFALATVVFCSLLAKRHVEHPKRTIRIWFYDVSKQGFAAFVLHAMNMGLSIFLKQDSGNECSWYLVNFMVDNFMGVPLNIGLLVLSDKIGKFILKNNYFESGSYGNPPRWEIWLQQAALWVMIIIAVKVTISFIVVYPFQTLLAAFGAILFGPIKDLVRLQLVLVMIVIPTLINIGQFWIQDNYLKRNGAEPAKKSDPINLGKQLSEDKLSPKTPPTNEPPTDSMPTIGDLSADISPTPSVISEKSDGQQTKPLIKSCKIDDRYVSKEVY